VCEAVTHLNACICQAVVVATLSTMSSGLAMFGPTLCTFAMDCAFKYKTCPAVDCAGEGVFHTHHPHQHSPHGHNPHRHSPHDHHPHVHIPHGHNPHVHVPHAHVAPIIKALTHLHIPWRRRMLGESAGGASEAGEAELRQRTSTSLRPPMADPVANGLAQRLAARSAEAAAEAAAAEYSYSDED